MTKIRNHTLLTSKKFAWLLAVYGADLSRWSETDAAAARELLAELSAARAVYREAELIDRALDRVEEMSVPAGLATRAANEALLRAGRKQTRAVALPVPKTSRARQTAPMWASALAVLLIVVFSWPAGRGPADVTKFMHTMDRMTNRTNQELRDADDVLGMLSVADSTESQPEHADEDGGITSEDLINTLFDNDAAEDADNANL